MSADHSTPAAKPSKPSDDFPLFAHATGRWAKKIKGKMIYFGRWDDPAGALRQYRDYVAGKRTPGVTPADGRPARPYPQFPLFAHGCGHWAKKIRGRLVYFGRWADDPQGERALAKYEADKDALHAGRKPRIDPDAITVKDVCNAFLNHKDALVASGELSPRTRAEYQATTDMLVAELGKLRVVSDVQPDDFAAMRKAMTKKWGPHRLCKMIQYSRSVFKHAYEAGLIDRPMRFGPGFNRPTKKTLRLHKASQDVKLFTADEILEMLDAAGVQLKAMILLGINAGFGNADCGHLPLTALDLDAGMIDFPRPKTGVARRRPIWPETVAAIRDVLATRKEPKDQADAGLVFITKYGYGWAKDTSTNPVSQETRKLMTSTGVNGHRGFYTLRHTFRTVADEAKDQPAADFIMGHESSHMSSQYRETISDERLQAVVNHVRAWLFKDAATR